MDTLAVLQPQINELQMQASFSSSSSSSSNTIFDLSDIIALCDKDVKLTTSEIKKIFKGLVNRISQIQLGQAIKEGNLRMSGSLSQDGGAKKGEQKGKDQDEDGDGEKKEFDLEIRQKTKSEMQNVKEVEQSSKKESKSPEKPKMKKRESKQKRPKAEQRKEINFDVQLKIKDLEVELQKIKNKIESNKKDQNKIEKPQTLTIEKKMQIGVIDSSKEFPQSIHYCPDGSIIRGNVKLKQEGSGFSQGDKVAVKMINHEGVLERIQWWVNGKFEAGYSLSNEEKSGIKNWEVMGTNQVIIDK